MCHAVVVFNIELNAPFAISIIFKISSSQLCRKPFFIVNETEIYSSIIIIYYNNNSNKDQQLLQLIILFDLRVALGIFSIISVLFQIFLRERCLLMYDSNYCRL